MPQHLKIDLKVAAVFGIFAIMLFGNTLLQEHDIQVEIAKYGCRSPKYDLACLGQNVKEEVLEGIDVGAGYMYLSSAIFVFSSLLLFDPKHYKRLTPILILSWIILSEYFVRLFSIGVITTSLMGVVNVWDSLYLGYVHDEILYIIPFIFIVGVIAGIAANYVSRWGRKKFIKTHNSA